MPSTPGSQEPLPSARGTVLELLQQVGSRPAAKFFVSALLEEHARELAQMLRAAACEEIDKQGTRTSPSDPKYDKAAGMVKAADLICPEGQ